MLTYNDLVNDMRSGCKKPLEWRIGIEHEQFVYDANTGLPLPYDGQPGIYQILNCFITDFGWEGVEKNGYLIELKRDGALITLEPGGQVEIATSPHQTLGQMKRQADRFYDEFGRVAAKLNFGILAKGFHPEWRRDQIQWMPKDRYRIMGPYMETRSAHGVDMMIRSCGAQINLDFSSENDMVKKFRVALGLQPVITALMANSHIVEGRESGYRCYRSFIWTETDPARCGVPEFVFENDMSFSRYVDYALDVPMYFIIRGGRYIDATGQSFRDFMDGKLKNHLGIYPDINDWHDHLTTLFPEVRLKSYLEFRGPDSTDKEQLYAMSAFWTGIFYDSQALDRAYQLIEGMSGKDHTRVRNNVPLAGLETEFRPDQTLKELGLVAMEIARAGLGVFEPAAVEDLNPFFKKLN